MNAPFEAKVETAFLFLGIIVLLVVDKEKGTINRVALSKTELAENTTTVSVKEFKNIKIPVDYQDNIIAKAIKTGEPQETTDWKDLFAPDLSAKEARLNQASGGIAYSAVHPLLGVYDGAALIFSYYQYRHEIGEPQHTFMKKYSEVVAKALAKSKN
ncbi:MAG: hypothetical protein JWO35_787 [Candidatus Saccharibacteria bacterium]|nr:hypothetical protein [Candidatus Saccharibacteria bacterium]